MANELKLSDDLFEDVPFEEETTTNNIPDDMFEDVEFDDSEPTSMTESLLRGGAQGLTFGFADEIAGGGEALIDTIFGDAEFSDIADTYKKRRDESRKAFEKSERDNPATAFIGELLGGAGAGLFTGGAGAVAGVGRAGAKAGMKELAKQGAKFGGAYGLGAGESDLLEGDISGALSDTAIGAGTGAAAGVVLPGVVKGVGKAAKGVKDAATKNIQLAKMIDEAKKLGQKGIKTFGDEGREGFLDLAASSADDIIKRHNLQLEKGSGMVGGALKEADRVLGKKDFSQALKKIETDIVDNPEFFLDSKEKKSISKFLDNFKGMEEVPVETVEEIQNRVLQEIRESQALKTRLAAMEGRNVTFTEPQLENIGGKDMFTFLQNTTLDNQPSPKFSTDITPVRQPKLTPEMLDDPRLVEEARAQSILDAFKKAQQKGEKKLIKESELGSQFSSTEPKLVTGERSGESYLVQNFIDQATQEAPISTQAIAREIPSVKTEQVEKFLPTRLQDIHKTRKGVAREAFSSSGNKSDTEKLATKKVWGELTDLLKTEMDNIPDANLKQQFERGNQLYSDSMKARDVIKGLSEENPINQRAKVMDFLKSDTASNELRQRDVVSLFEDQSGISQIMDNLKMRQALTKDLSDISFSQPMKAVTGGASKLLTSSANIAGLGQKKASDMIAKIPGGNLSSMTNDQLSQLSTRLRSSDDEVFKRLFTHMADNIDKALESPKTQRDALLWSLSQQPGFRGLFDIRDEEVEE